MYSAGSAAAAALTCYGARNDLPDTYLLVVLGVADVLRTLYAVPEHFSNTGAILRDSKIALEARRTDEHLSLPYFDVVAEQEVRVLPGAVLADQGTLSIGVFVAPDPTGDSGNPDATFVFGEVHGELLFLTVEFLVTCFEHPKLAPALYALSQDFAVHKKPVMAFIDALGTLGISPWQPGGSGGSYLLSA